MEPNPGQELFVAEKCGILVSVTEQWIICCAPGVRVHLLRLLQRSGRAVIHMKKKLYRHSLALLSALCLISGCGNASAASMHLRKTEGTVSVSDAEGQSVAPAENLGLYSGYGVGTEAESYAWIDLDHVKLAKMDQSSQISVSKEDKALSIDVISGSLFFNVTEPLADDETMDIRTSTMAVGIRGTCGWVEIPEADVMRVYILEGTVICTAGENTAAVGAGEMAEMTAEGEITVEKFSVLGVPDFVAKELEADESLNQAVKDASGLDVAGDPLRAYGDYLNNLIKSNDWELVFAEEVDFEGDGRPELAAIFVYELQYESLPNIVKTYILRNGPEGLDVLLERRVGWPKNGQGHGKVSLMESGGRRFLLYHNLGVSNENLIYYGSIASQDGDSSCWGIVDAVGNNNADGSLDDFVGMKYGKGPVREDGLVSPGIMEYSTLEEITAVIEKYTEERVLFSLDF